jgi:cation:H+ antiporter
MTRSAIAMTPVVVVWLQFGICALLIALAGSQLARYGDIIADKTGLGGNWIGLVLLATVTSLPELITGLSAVTAARVPDIAIGDVLGSCVFNLVIITALDFLRRDESVFTRASQGHILSAGFGVILIGIVGFNVLLAGNRVSPALGHVGVYTPAILLIYLIAMRSVFRYERAQIKEAVAEQVDRYPETTLRKACVRYTIAALVVIAAGVWLPFVGVELARVMAWQQTFVGTLFVAFATSVPEIVVTVSALRLGALDMAIANLLGSNLFDIAIVAIDDIAFLPGPILAQVSPLHAVSALSAIMMSGVVIVGLLYRPPQRLFRGVGWASLFLLTIYLLNTFVLYLHG